MKKVKNFNNFGLLKKHWNTTFCVISSSSGAKSIILGVFCRENDLLMNQYDFADISSWNVSE